MTKSDCASGEESLFSQEEEDEMSNWGLDQVSIDDSLLCSLLAAEDQNEETHSSQPYCGEPTRKEGIDNCRILRHNKCDNRDDNLSDNLVFPTELSSFFSLIEQGPQS